MTSLPRRPVLVVRKVNSGFVNGSAECSVLGRAEMSALTLPLLVMESIIYVETSACVPTNMSLNNAIIKICFYFITSRKVKREFRLRANP